MSIYKMNDILGFSLFVVKNMISESKMMISIRVMLTCAFMTHVKH